MKTIYKYLLAADGPAPCTVAMPAGARILSVGADCYDQLCVWAEVDPSKPLDDFKQFYVLGTGWPLIDGALEGLKFLGSVRCDPYIWHVFLKKEIMDV